MEIINSGDNAEKGVLKIIYEKRNVYTDSK